MNMLSSTPIYTPVACGIGIGALAENAVIRAAWVFCQSCFPPFLLKAFRANANAICFMRQAFIRIKRLIAALTIASIAFLYQEPAFGRAVDSNIEPQSQTQQQPTNETRIAVSEHEAQNVWHAFLLGLLAGCPFGILAGSFVFTLQNRRIAEEVNSLRIMMEAQTTTPEGKKK